MMRISIVVLHVLSVLPRPSNPEHLPSVFDDNDAAEDIETVLRYQRHDNPSQNGSPLAYLYMTNELNPPADTHCLSCLYELHLKQTGKFDPCECLPCWIQTSKDDEAQDFVIGIFERHDCSPTKSRKNGKQRKQTEGGIDRTKARKSKSRTNSGETARREHNLEKSGSSGGRTKPKVVRSRSRSSKNDRSSRKPEKCTGEDCEDTETRKARVNSHDVAKEKVKRVFNSVLTKMSRMNRASEEDTETPENISLKSDKLKTQRSEKRSQRQHTKRYQDDYDRPSFKISTYSTHQENGKRRRNEKDDDPESEDEEVKVKSKETRRDESSESKDRKSMTSRKEKTRKADGPKEIPEDISIGSLTTDEVITFKAAGDDEDVNGEEYKDTITAAASSMEKEQKQEEVEKDYVIQYDDDEESQITKTVVETTTESKDSTKSYDETMNTPNDDVDASTSTTETPSFTFSRSGTKETASYGTEESSETPSTTTEEPTSTVMSSTFEITASDESTVSTEESIEEDKTESTSESNTTEESESSSDESTSQEDKSTTASTSLVLKYTNESRTEEMATDGEEHVTEEMFSSTAPTTDATPSESSSATNPEATITFGRKFTRSTNPTTAITSDVESHSSDAGEFTRRDRFLRQTDYGDARSDALRTVEMTKTTEPSAVKSDGTDRNVTEQKPARYIIELEENSAGSGTNRNPEDPILKVKMNVYSDSARGNVFNFLSRLIPRSGGDGEKPCDEPEDTNSRSG